MKENFFENYFSGKKGFYACLAVLILICFFVFKDFILLRSVFLYKDVASDSINFSYAQFLNVSEYLRLQGFPKWSFTNGMGQNIFPLILKDPTDIFVYLLKRDSIAFVIIFKELFKIILSGIVFYMFLQKLSLTKYTSIVGAMLYSFTGFMILGSGWYIFTFEALMLASLLLAFEKIFQDNAWYLFPLIIALLAISMPFNLYVYGLFLIVYMLFRYIYEKGTELKGLFMLVAKMVMLTLLGLGIGSMFFFSNIKQLLESARVSGDVTYFDTLTTAPVLGLADGQNYMTSILRFFSNDILGTGLNFRGWYNYLEAPLFYCGLLTLLLIPQVFVHLNKKQKILYGAFIAIWILPIVFPYLRYAFWLFTGDYYRAFSLCVDTCFIFVGLNALNYIDRSGKINLVILVATFLCLLILLYYPYTDQPGIINKDIRSSARNFILLYAVLLYLMGLSKYKQWTQIAMLFILFIELTYFSYTTVNKKRTAVTAKELKQKVGFNDYSMDAVAYLDKIDKSFYRIDKIYSSSLAYNGGLNDPQAQFYKGTGSYNSFNQKYYIKFLKGVNVTNPKKDEKAELESKRITGLINRPLLESLCSVKYIFSKQKNNSYMYLAHDSVAQFGDVVVFRKKNYLPVGLTYNKYIFADDFAKLADNQKDVLLFKALVIEEKDKDKYNGFARLEVKDTVSTYSWEAYQNDVKQLKNDTLSLTEFNQNMLKGTIAVDARKAMFFSIPYDIGWSATVDGKAVPLELADYGLMAVFIDKGEHTVELNYTVPYLSTGVLVSCCSLAAFLIMMLWSEYKKRKARLDNLSQA
jgi:uncharacterized membrane protein YfhO